MNATAPLKCFAAAAPISLKTQGDRAAHALAGGALVVDLSYINGATRPNEKAQSELARNANLKSVCWYTPQDSAGVIQLVDTMYQERRKAQVEADLKGSKAAPHIRDLPVYLHENGVLCRMRSRFLRTKNQERDLTEMVEQILGRNATYLAETERVSKKFSSWSAESVFNHVTRNRLPNLNPTHIVMADFEEDTQWCLSKDRANWHSRPIAIGTRQAILTIDITDRPDMVERLTLLKNNSAIIARFNEQRFAELMAKGDDKAVIMLPLDVHSPEKILPRPLSEGGKPVDPSAAPKPQQLTLL